MNDKVNHPQHYNIPGRKECIDEMLDVFGIEAVKHFCMLNAYKYRNRQELKNGAEDFAKAEWYENKLRELEGVVNDEQAAKNSTGKVSEQ